MRKLENHLPAGFIGDSYFQTEQGLEILSSKALKNVWVVSRGCCHYKKIEIGRLPEAKLQSFLTTNLPLVSPFKNSGFWFKRQSSNLHLWIWDKSRQNDIAQTHAINLDHFLVVPASCFSKQQEGSEIYIEPNGACFAQVWKDGDLLGDSWWQAFPSQTDWEIFLLGLGLDISPPSAGSSLGFEKCADWTAIGNFIVSRRRLEWLVAMSAALVFALIFAFQSATTLRSTYLVNTLRSEIKDLRVQTSDSMMVKDIAEKALNELNELRILRAPGQLQLINDVSKSLPDSTKKILRWDYRNDKQLTVIVEAEKPDIEAYVKALEDLPRVSGVEITSSASGQIKLEIGML